ncbi:MAG TPA: DUF4232 domain-containing protein [Streptosporangiaceae bacterium]|nr:DUF4232 domain-containing protein [Streptosporangiaceae bacterium]
MMSRLRTAGPAVAAAVVVALAAAGCGSTVALVARAGSPSPPVSPVSERGAVPWVDRPGRLFLPSPLPAQRLPANARPCTAAQVRVSPDGGNGGGGHSYQTFAFRNVSRTTCILRGYPAVVASEPVKAEVTAADGGFFVGRELSGNMPPGGITTLSLETERDCPARYANPAQYPHLIYHTVTVGIPGGGHVVINQAFDVLCGLYTGQFAMAQPPQRYTQSPVTGASAAIELPSGVVAGTTLDYVVDLTNPTGTVMMLSPCPGYQQDLGAAGKAILALNCRAQPRIPAHQTVRFAMQLQVAAGTPTGPDTVYWEIAGPVGVSAHGSLRIFGHDTPCRSAQLRATITGPGRIPGPPNVLGAKEIATEVPLDVTNISGQPCSVDGVPSVSIRAADGSDLGLRQVLSQQFSPQPVLWPETAITLAPHTGTAQTTLYWYLPWCGPDPNPVTVTITFPANNAAITVTPTGGWNPPPCHRASPGSQSNPGLVSADQLRPA